MEKKLSETDLRSKFITPVMVAACTTIFALTSRKINVITYSNFEGPLYRCLAIHRFYNSVDEFAAMHEAACGK